MTNNSRPLPFIPVSKNFSEFRNGPLDGNSNEDPLAYEVSDQGEFSDAVLMELQGDDTLLSLLMSLDHLEKIILLYHVMKEMGFNLTQEQYAKTLSFSRVYYTSLARNVREKCHRIIQGAAKQV